MTCGIYILKFKGTDSVYVGQSINIEYRYKKHLLALRNGYKHANYKMKHAYAKYGEPELEILCECSQEQLNALEAEAMEIYDAVASGYNIATEPDIHLSGTQNPASKFSKEQILGVFDAIVSANASYKQIADKYNTSESFVRHIANGEAHTYLKEEYPDKYALMLANKTRRSVSNSAGIKGKVYPPIVSPEGVEYTVTYVSEFAKEHGLDSSCLSKVLRKVPKYLSHKGWKLKT
jgi:predicted GIY-YIG superfamily endonuclease